MINLASTEFKKESTREFLSTLQEFTNLIGQRKINIKPWNEHSIAKLVSMPEDRQRQVEAQFKSYMNLVSTTKDFPQNEEISELRLLESCAEKLGIVFDPSVYTSVEKHDIIEIYTTDLIQIYRSLGFFNLCSYNLLDLLTNEWFELYERSLQVNHLLLEAANKMTSRPYSLEPISLHQIPQHIMREKFSDGKYSFEIQFKQTYPIYSWKRELYGFLMVLEAKKVETASSKLAFI